MRTAETRDALPPRYPHKVRQLTDIDISSIRSRSIRCRADSKAGASGVSPAGRFPHWKRTAFGPPAFAEFLKICPDARLTIAGDGPEPSARRELAVSLGINGQIDWIGWQIRRAVSVSDYVRDKALAFCPRAGSDK